MLSYVWSLILIFALFIWPVKSWPSISKMFLVPQPKFGVTAVIKVYGWTEILCTQQSIITGPISSIRITLLMYVISIYCDNDAKD